MTLRRLLPLLTTVTMLVTACGSTENAAAPATERSANIAETTNTSETTMPTETPDDTTGDMAPADDTTTPVTDDTAPSDDTAATDGGAGSSDVAVVLAERRFLSTAVDGRDLVVGTRITLGSPQGMVGVSAGCNAIGGQASFDGSVLVLGGLGSTMIGCETT